MCEPIESVQFKAPLTIVGAIKETSQAKLYKELGLEGLKFRRWCRRLCMLYKVKTSGLPLNLSKYIPKGNQSYNTRLNEGGLKTYHCRTDVFKYLFFPYATSEWNKLDLQIPKANSLLSFKNALLKLGRPVPISCFNIYNPVGLKLLTRLRAGLSHLNEHKFKHNFSNCINLLCSNSLEVKSITHFFLHCLCFLRICKILFNKLISICRKFVDLPDSSKVELLLCGSPDLSFIQNSSIINASINFITKSECFKGNLF